jgi:hypothetical protein
VPRRINLVEQLSFRQAALIPRRGHRTREAKLLPQHRGWITNEVVMKSVDYLKLAAVLAVTAVSSAPAFADQGSRMAAPSTETMQTTGGTQGLVPFPKKWWAED